MKSADPLIPPADLRNENVQLTVVTNPYSQKMNVSDLGGGGDDPAHAGDDAEHGHQDARRSDL